MKIYLLFLCALTVVLMIILNSCAPAITYQGKYGTYSATPSGEIIIRPHYAK